jgi:hypothetical protein
MTDIYPEFSGLVGRTQQSLLITGTSADGSPLLRIVDEKKRLSTYKLQYQNKAASVAVWTLLIPGHDSSPDMLYSTIDGRAFTAQGVSVAMSPLPYASDRRPRLTLTASSVMDFTCGKSRPIQACSAPL